MLQNRLLSSTAMAGHCHQPWVKFCSPMQTFCEVWNVFHLGIKPSIWKWWLIPFRILGNNSTVLQEPKRMLDQDYDGVYSVAKKMQGFFTASIEWSKSDRWGIVAEAAGWTLELLFLVVNDCGCRQTVVCHLTRSISKSQRVVTFHTVSSLGCR